MLTERPAILDVDQASDTDRTPRVVWEDTPCPLCQRDQASLLLEAPDPTPTDGNGLWFAVVRCAYCELTYTNPRPTASTITHFYPADYRPHRRPRKMADSRGPRPLLARVLGRPCNERRGTLPWHGAGRLLDFGCGGGHFLKRMADRGWSVTGLDAAVGAVRRIQDDLGLQALVGSLPHPDLKPCTFDVITMWHSLEHVHDPLAILREAYRLLVPGGRLVVATPNIESLPYYWFGQSWFGLDLPRHLTHFTPQTLLAMLQTAGFEVNRVRMLRHSDWLRSSARIALSQGRGNWKARCMTWKPIAKLVAWGCYAVGLSDCMMTIAQRPL